MPECDYQHRSRRYSSQLVPASGLYGRSLLASQLSLSSNLMGHGEALAPFFAQVVHDAPTIPAGADCLTGFAFATRGGISVAGSAYRAQDARPGDRSPRVSYGTQDPRVLFTERDFGHHAPFCRGGRDSPCDRGNPDMVAGENWILRRWWTWSKISRSRPTATTCFIAEIVQSRRQ